MKQKDRFSINLTLRFYIPNTYIHDKPSHQSRQRNVQKWLMFSCNEKSAICYMFQSSLVRIIDLLKLPNGIHKAEEITLSETWQWRRLWRADRLKTSSTFADIRRSSGPRYQGITQEKSKQDQNYYIFRKSGHEIIGSIWCKMSQEKKYLLIPSQAKVIRNILQMRCRSYLCISRFTFKPALWLYIECSFTLLVMHFLIICWSHSIV